MLFWLILNLKPCLAARFETTGKVPYEDMIPANNTWRRRPLGKGGWRDSLLHLEGLKRQNCQLYLSSLTGIEI